MPPVFGKERRWVTSAELCSGVHHLTEYATVSEATKISRASREKDFNISVDISYAAVPGERAAGVQ